MEGRIWCQRCVVVSARRNTRHTGSCLCTTTAQQQWGCVNGGCDTTHSHSHSHSHSHTYRSQSAWNVPLHPSAHLTRTPLAPLAAASPSTTTVSASTTADVLRLPWAAVLTVMRRAHMAEALGTACAAAIVRPPTSAGVRATEAAACRHAPHTLDAPLAARRATRPNIFGSQGVHRAPQNAVHVAACIFRGPRESRRWFDDKMTPRFNIEVARWRSLAPAQIRNRKGVPFHHRTCCPTANRGLCVAPACPTMEDYDAQIAAQLRQLDTTVAAVSPFNQGVGDCFDRNVEMDQRGRRLKPRTNNQVGAAPELALLAAPPRTVQPSPRATTGASVVRHQNQRAAHRDRSH